MGKTTTVDIDLAKNVFSVHGIDELRAIVVRKTVTRSRLVETVARWPGCFIDAEAICEAVQRPNMRFVPVKSPEQQALLSLHRVRQGFVEERTATINRIRAVLCEFGVVLPRSAREVRHAAMAAAENPVEALAIAIGTLRGAYKFSPKPTGDILAIDRIKDIHARITRNARIELVPAGRA